MCAAVAVSVAVTMATAEAPAAVLPNADLQPPQLVGVGSRLSFLALPLLSPVVSRLGTIEKTTEERPAQLDDYVLGPPTNGCAEGGWPTRRALGDTICGDSDGVGKTARPDR
ncbi:hypothetical protein OG775_33095 [Streptomyces platensis]|uniref:hypothetical protein n=1 Tax=Streptomyces platensis TaxID=58346 RepID=UPI00225967E3|nr:hypothetical protein [Streptomyces platensis]MCX4639891.1 hypothetical protein [Streptomyces platensis]